MNRRLDACLDRIRDTLREIERSDCEACVLGLLYEIAVAAFEAIVMMEKKR